MADFNGIGAIGDSGNIRAYISADSPSITTPAQIATARRLDQLSEAYDGLEFVEDIPEVAEATKDVIYIDKNGTAKFLADGEDELTEL